MSKGPGVLIAKRRVQPSGPTPRLRLLTELEPGHRVFFDNLADLLLSRRVRQPFISARPAAFWNDVFVPSGTPWSSFLESMLGHLLLIILVVWAQSRVWPTVKLFQEQDALHRSISYSPPTQSFPAAASRAARVRTRAPVKHRSPHRRAMTVRPQQKPGIVTPPDIKQATARLPNLPDSHPVTPMAPFSATTGARQNKLAEPSGVVAPPPQVEQAASRGLALPQAPGVAPAPELGGNSTGRALEAPNTGGVPIVPPPPSVQNAGNSARGEGITSLSGAGTNVVPPPPSVQGGGNAAGDPRLGSLAGAGAQVVPPPPSVQGLVNSSGTGHGDWPSPTGLQVVPPPPSVQGSDGPAGTMRSLGRAGSAGAGARLGSGSGDGSQIIPPPPSVEGAGNNADAGGRLGSLSGGGSQIVPPPPSVEGAGNNAGAGGRLGSLSEGGSQIVSPPPPSGGTGNSGAGGAAKATDPQLVASSTKAAGNNENRPTIEELPLASLGLVFAAPGTSFFSNFEVFVAKRRVGKDQLQLMKLVYEFLPYQRRLSEYHLDDLPPRVIKLRVIPDPSCNESLGRIIEPHTEAARTGKAYPQLPPELRSADLNAVLPCYRTTAEDFQKAMSRAR